MEEINNRKLHQGEKPAKLAFEAVNEDVADEVFLGAILFMLLDTDKELCISNEHLDDCVTLAAKTNHICALNALLDQKHKRGTNFSSASLYYAVRAGNANAATILLSQNAKNNVNECYNGATPLSVAVGYCQCT